MSNDVTTWYITLYHCEQYSYAIQNDHAQQAHGAYRSSASGELLSLESARRLNSYRLTWSTKKNVSFTNSQIQKAFEDASLFSSARFDRRSTTRFVAQSSQLSERHGYILNQLEASSNDLYVTLQTRTLCPVDLATFIW